MPEAVIVDAIRTPIGRAAKGRSRPFAPRPRGDPAEGADRAQPALEQTSIGDIMMGCGYGEGESGYNIGRIAVAARGHGLPRPRLHRQPLLRLLAADPRMAFHAINAGEGDTYIAAGVEAVSRTGRGASSSQPAARRLRGLALQRLHPHGMTAENVAERCNVSREAQDEWALVSQTRAVAAGESGHFDAEIVPVTVPAHKDVDKEGKEIDVPETVVTKDDGPRPGTSMEGLAALKPVFKEGGRSPPATPARSTTAPRRS